MTKKTETKKFIIEVIGEKVKVNKYGDKLHSLIDDLGWEYQRMGMSGHTTQSNIIRHRDCISSKLY